MKQIRKKLFVALLLLLGLHAEAQDFKQKIGFKLQPEITIKFSDDYHDSQYVKYKFQLFSFNFGVQYVYSINNRLGLETGAYWQSQKYQTTYSANSLTVETQFNLIQIPVALRLNLDQLYFTLGSSLNYQVDTKWKTSDGSKVTGGNKDDGSVLVGLIGTIGKDWKVSDKASIITEVRISGAPGKAAGANIGFGIGSNFKL